MRSYLVATFADDQTLLRAVRAIVAARIRIYDVYGPYPVPHIDEAMTLHESRLPWFTLGGAIAGLLAGVGLQVYTTVLDWPMNVGGKPDNSILAFVPITFELSILTAGLVTVAALFLRARLFPGARERLVNPGVTEATFAVVLRKRDDRFDTKRAYRLLQQYGAIEIRQSEGSL